MQYRRPKLKSLDNKENQHTSETPTQTRKLFRKTTPKLLQPLQMDQHISSREPLTTKVDGLHKIRLRTYVSTVENLMNDNLLKLIPPTCDGTTYSIGQSIGKGSYATVRLGTNKQGLKVAIKVYEKLFLKGERLNNLVKEISALKALNHEQIVKLLDVYHCGSTINLVLEYCGSESLFTLVKQHRALSKDYAFNIIHQLLKILVYIHEKNICHRDIKLENILITNKKIKLIDFGFSTIYNSITCHCGTPSYMSPEVVTKQKYDGRTTDIWALGVLFVGLLQGSFPYKGSTEKELFSKIRNNEYTINSQDKDVRVFLGQIFVLDPHHRATARELLQCDVFRSL
ncbi:unnamed protein product [Paramecium octaurelia]|uniref:Protein kinase domain-containing protein n=1 Tax=Paramecium octaurelia TaxID=43137 RepID=A0A8S1UGF7_PAROT|nr:unnamed protein product [Paramecium octaurelia]